jgi:ketosteroid isomerase-like protein
MSAIDAERAFAADAQRNGQWTAFRKWSTPDALMFVPQPVNARAYLGKLKNPAIPVYWWPGRSYVSCDGSVAINTGPWVRDFGKSVGYFTTVWVRQKDGSWKWIYDAGDDEQFMRGEGGDIAPVVAACTKPKMPSVAAAPPTGFKVGSGRSPDGSLEWAWAVGPDGSRTFLVNLWDGTKRQTVIEDKVTPKAATKPK